MTQHNVTPTRLGMTGHDMTCNTEEIWNDVKDQMA